MVAVGVDIAVFLRATFSVVDTVCVPQDAFRRAGRLRRGVNGAKDVKAVGGTGLEDMIEVMLEW